MRFISHLVGICLLLCSSVAASDFTVCSYNCGGLSDHYDYIRALCMHKLMQERHNEEPKEMAQLEKIESIALKILFGSDHKVNDAEFKRLTAHPFADGSPNLKWHKRYAEMLTSYTIRPVVIYDEEVRDQLLGHIQDLTHGQAKDLSNESIDAARRVMARRIFTHELKYDILALQEADYLDASLFPANYQVLFTSRDHSVNGVAWNRERFELVEEVGDLMGRGFAVKLREIASDQTVMIISAHLTGCNPFIVVDGDSEKGDRELRLMLDLLNSTDADIKLIAMDSNVTATHPRLALLKEAGFMLDTDNYLEATCSSPWQVLNTRIDWIAVQSAEISNIPVLGVGLNSPQSNMSDHKPIAARISSHPVAMTSIASAQL